MITKQPQRAFYVIETTSTSDFWVYRLEFSQIFTGRSTLTRRAQRDAVRFQDRIVLSVQTQ